MTKTLLITYCPRYERSNTLKLAKHMRSAAKGEVETLDLVANPPELLLKDNLSAYYKRNYGGEKLAENEAKLLDHFDSYVAQLKKADVVVLAYPMYNFSLPAAVKAWFDAILLKGETWDMKDGGFVGLMGGKKAVVITTSGGKYHSDYGNLAFEHSLSLSKALFQFMGFEQIELVSAEGINMEPAKKEQVLGEASAKLDAVAKKYYG